jgi:hypothetical protein
VIEKYEEISSSVPDFVSAQMVSSERFYNFTEENTVAIGYDAYDKDIAMVQARGAGPGGRGS